MGLPLSVWQVEIAAFTVPPPSLPHANTPLLELCTDTVPGSSEDGVKEYRVFQGKLLFLKHPLKAPYICA